MNQPDNLSILALIPAYNEAGRISAVIAGTKSHLPVLVIDDGSKDDTAAVAEAAGASVLRQIPNQGKGAALQAGYRWALDQGYQAVIMLDADGQHDPAEIPAFLAAYAAHQPDLIIGERNFTQMPFPRNLSNTIGRWTFSRAVGQPIKDNQSGYRLLSRRLMEAMLTSSERGFEFEVEMIVLAVARGWTVEGVPIRTIYEGAGSHIRPLAHIANYFRILRRTRAMMRQARGEPVRPGLAPAWIMLQMLLVVGVIALFVVLSDDDSEEDDSPAGTEAPEGVIVLEFETEGTPPPAVTFIPPTPAPTETEAPHTDEMENLLIDQPVPDLVFTTLDGDSIRLTDLQGKVVILNFWATWCEPCKEEMPLLQRLQDERGDEVQIIAITDPESNQSEAAIRAFLDAYKLTLPVALWPEIDMYRIFEVMGFPTTFVVDQTGNIRFHLLGTLHAADLVSYLEQLGVSWTG